jgi:shikimate kinase
MTAKEISNIVLIGPMGSGKSTVGKKLAKKLGLTFYDSDKEIEAHTGAAISLIFELEGEAGFRKREKEIVAALCAMSNVVLATGGGVILDPDNRTALKNSGHVIYLKASADQLFDRTRHDKSRPLLQTDNPREKLEAILNEREPIYESIADDIIDTDHLSVTEVADAIIETLHHHNTTWAKPL